MRGDLCPFDHGQDPVIVEDVSLQSMITFGPPVTGKKDDQSFKL